ncbi:hypothetical protein [Nocardioides sp. SYSU D00038]|nr:hypothetical protein [Nocardioides sp. SYSU D00038]
MTTAAGQVCAARDAGATCSGLPEVVLGTSWGVRPTSTRPGSRLADG